MTQKIYLIVSLLLIIFSNLLFSQPDTKNTRLMRQPAISKNHIAFVYANDLWIADKDGKNPRRLTADLGTESIPVFSPDEKTIAFSAQYDGNMDIYTISVDGGIPKRITFHPGADIIRGFSKDGSSLIFISQRESFTNRYFQLYTIPVSGGIPKALPIPYVWQASYSPDGKYIAYTPLSERYLQWKHYRGGTVSNICIYNVSDHSVEKIQQPEGRCNDSDPMWIGGKIYFISDRNGEFNLFSFDTKSKEIKQLTNYTDFPILSPSAGNGEIIFENAGYLNVYNISDGKTAKLTIGIGADLLSLRPKYVKGINYNRYSAISPNGSRAIFEMRGDIITVPAEKGDPRNITNTSGVFERFPNWSPDGQNIAYFSDESGEYELVIKRSDGKGEVKKFKINGAGFYYYPEWSPDNQKIFFSDNSSSLYYIDIKSGNVKKFDQYRYTSLGGVSGNWSPDSKWIVYTNRTKGNFGQIFVYSIEQEKSFPITDGMSDAENPVFDKSGKYIYFFASTNAGPARQGMELSFAEARSNSNIYLAVLGKDSSSPLKKESDEEKINDNGKKSDKDEKDDKAAKTEKTDKKEKSAKPVIIDFENISNRIIPLPLSAGYYSGLNAGNDNEFYYLESIEGTRGRKLHKYDLKNKKDEVILQGINGYDISANRNKILYSSPDGWKISSISGKIEPDKGKLNMESIEIFIEPQKEWKQIFDEAWRINRDYFYDPNMHGADWNAMKKKYSVFLPDLSCRQDLNRVMQWMMSELGVGHSYINGPGDVGEVKTIQGGLLGADYSIENGRYRFKKIYGGLTWTPDLRAPLMEPGFNIKEGEYLLAVNGKDLRSNMNIYSMFENTAGKMVEITVGPDADGKNSRNLVVTPIDNESSLRNRDWVESNIRKVDEATNGKVAYVYVPNTADMGYEYFKRYFFPQAYKDAIIIDERFNGGGSIADYYIDHLKKEYICSNTGRYCEDNRFPNAMIPGPKVMLIDETAGSGGDLLPWMFKKFNMGKIIGKRTWGGLVGIGGYPPLIDNGRITSPNMGLWAGDEWICENIGVPPDIEVDQTPAEVMKGHDPQLEKAIQVVIDELKKNPVKEMKHPPFPVKMKK
jgi:tricorn protease